MNLLVPCLGSALFYQSILIYNMYSLFFFYLFIFLFVFFCRFFFLRVVEMAVVQLLYCCTSLFFTYYIVSFFVSPVMQLQVAATGLLSCLTINDAYRCMPRLYSIACNCLLHQQQTTRPQQPLPLVQWLSSNNQTRAQLQTSPASSWIPSFYLSLSLVSLCTLVSVCVYVWRWISVDLSSSSSSRQKQEEKPFFLKKKLLPFLCSYSSCLCWFIYQDLRLYFDDHHHLFLVYFLCNFVSYRRDEFANTKGKSKR